MCFIFYPEVLDPEVYKLLEQVNEKLGKPICAFENLVTQHFSKCQPHFNLSWLFDKPKHELFLHNALNNQECYLVLDPSNLEVLIDDWTGYIDNLFVLVKGDELHTPYINETPMAFRSTKVNLEKKIEDNLELIQKKMEKFSYV